MIDLNYNREKLKPTTVYDKIIKKIVVLLMCLSSIELEIKNLITNSITIVIMQAFRSFHFI